MAAAIVHRGPDDEGFLQDGAFAMGMRRLSIIDLAGGHQPITNETGNLSIVFNGRSTTTASCARRCSRAATGSAHTATPK